MRSRDGTTYRAWFVVLSHQYVQQAMDLAGRVVCFQDYASLKYGYLRLKKRRAIATVLRSPRHGCDR